MTLRLKKLPEPVPWQTTSTAMDYYYPSKLTGRLWLGHRRLDPDCLLLVHLAEPSGVSTFYQIVEDGEGEGEGEGGVSDGTP